MTHTRRYATFYFCHPDCIQSPHGDCHSLVILRPINEFNENSIWMNKTKAIAIYVQPWHGWCVCWPVSAHRRRPGHCELFIFVMEALVVCLHASESNGDSSCEQMNNNHFRPDSIWIVANWMLKCSWWIVEALHEYFHTFINSRIAFDVNVHPSGVCSAL